MAFVSMERPQRRLFSFGRWWIERGVDGAVARTLVVIDLWGLVVLFWRPNATENIEK